LGWEDLNEKGERTAFEDRRNSLSPPIVYLVPIRELPRLSYQIC